VTAAEVTPERVLAAVRSVPNSLIPAPRTPTHDDAGRDDTGWQRAGRYEIRFHDEDRP
jgi:hypothetical protein